MSYLKTMLALANPEVIIEEGAKPLYISPIPRAYNKNHEPVYETHPSCGFSVMSDGTELLKDFTDEAGIGYNGHTLAMKLEELDSVRARKVFKNYEFAEKTTDFEFGQWDLNAKRFISDVDGECTYVMEKYGFSKKVLEELQVQKDPDTEFIVPVINNGVLLRIGYYHPSMQTKWHYTTGTEGSLIVGFDQWVYNYEEPTLICEGQKDMMIARSKGYNAICFTNGCQSIPELYPKYFKDRVCHIVYDNDDPGRKGARRLAVWLREKGAKSIKIVEGFHEYLPDKGDIYDWFQTLGKTKKELDQIIEETKEFNEQDYETEVQNIYPVLTLSEALEKQNIGKTVQTDLMVLAEYGAAWVFPEDVLLKVLPDEETIEQNYSFTVEKPRTFLKLKGAESFQHKYIMQNAKNDITGAVGIGSKDTVLEWFVKSKQTMYAAEVAAITNNWDPVNSGQNMTLTAYTFEKKPMTGKKYRFRYKIVADPVSSVMVMLVEDFILLNDKNKKFEMNDQERLELMNAFSVPSGSSVKQKMNEFFNDMRGYIGPRLDKDLWLATDLCFNSVLEFKWHDKIIRGTLDTAIIGDAGFGKSYTFDHLQRLYREGYKVASENATVISIIGGTSTKNQTKKTTIGVLGQQDGGLVCFEESTRLGEELMRYMNDIRSSGRSNVNRIDGNITYSAKLRYIFIANQKEGIKNMIYNPNGLIPIKGIFSKPEHRRRFDYILTTGLKDPLAIASNVRKQIRNYTPELTYREELYQKRLKWVWSRTPEQVKFSQDFEDKVYECYSEWQEKYWTGEALFGSSEEEFILKITRIAIAVAGMLYNSPDGKTLLVNAKHADFAYNDFFKKIYESPLFKIDVVSRLAKLNEIPSQEDIKTIETIYKANEDNRLLIESMIMNSEPVSKTILDTYIPERERLNAILTTLMRWHLVGTEKDKYFATNKLKSGFALIDRSSGHTLEDKKIDEKKGVSVNASDFEWE